MTKKSTIETLIELREKAYEISRTNPTKIAIEVKQEFNEDLRKLKATEDYKEAGISWRIRHEEKLREKYRKELFEVLAEQKAEYEKIAKQAKELAQVAALKENDVPENSLEVKAFEKKLDQLVVATALAKDGTRSVQAIDSFLTQYDSPYYAEKLNEKFPSIMGNILAIDNTSGNRDSLSRLFDRITFKAKSEEHLVAEETLGVFGDGVPKFYREGLPQERAISEIIGGQHARYLNEPEKWIETHSQAETQAE